MVEIVDAEMLYASLAARDGAFAGRVYVGVVSTGIFLHHGLPLADAAQEELPVLRDG